MVRRRYEYFISIDKLTLLDRFTTLLRCQRIYALDQIQKNHPIQNSKYLYFIGNNTKLTEHVHPNSKSRNYPTIGYKTIFEKYLNVGQSYVCFGTGTVKQKIQGLNFPTQNAVWTLTTLYIL